MGGTDVFRGVLVIVVALGVGAFVFSRGLDEATGDEAVTEAADQADPDPAGSGATGDQAITEQTVAETTTPTTVAPSTTTVTTQPTTTELLLRPPADVRVLVLNGAQTQGIAAKGTEVLMSFGYTTAAPKNATTQRPSVILHNPGFEGEALAVAEAFGPDLAPLVTPYDPADPPIDDTQEADVIVIIGNDDLIPVG